MKKRIIASVISIVLLIGIVSTGVILHNNGVLFPDKAQAKQQVLKNNEITYKGQDHITALLLLQQIAKVETSGTGNMAFVSSINGIKADAAKNQFWAFNVNGKAATVGAGSYVTTSKDTIAWKLSTF